MVLVLKLGHTRPSMESCSGPQAGMIGYPQIKDANNVIMGRCIKSVNIVIGAQCEYVIMQLMVGNMIIMYEYSIKEDHNKFAKEMYRLIYHG